MLSFELQPMQKVEPYDEGLLLNKVAEGDDRAFGELVKLKWNNIYSQALTYVKSTHRAEDIVQEVFLKIWEKRQAILEVDNFDSYLFIVARNYIISELRKKIAVPIGDNIVDTFEEESKQPDKVFSNKQLIELITKGIEMLPQQQKVAFRLSRDEGLSHEKIAELMELSKETVKKHICRALNFLRTYVRTQSELIILFMVLFRAWLKSFFNI